MADPIHTLGFRPFDADNHYYEALDAFTRHLDPRHATRVFEWAKIGKRSYPVLGGKVVIHAKRYRDTVGVSAVRDLYGTMLNEGANKGILVCTSGYGPDAYNFSKDKPIELIDGGGLLYLLREHAGTTARIAI